MTELCILESDPPILIIDLHAQSEINNDQNSAPETVYSQVSKAIAQKDVVKLSDILQQIEVGNGEADLLLSVYEEGNNLLHLVALHGYPTTMQICLKPSTGSPGTYCDCLRILLQFCIKHRLLKHLDVENTSGNTPLRLALQKKCSKCIKELVRVGASINIKQSRFEQSSNTQSHMPFVTPKLFNRNPSTIEYFIRSMNSRITQPDCTTTSVILDNEANNSPPDTCDESDEMAEVIEMDFSSIVTSMSNGNQPKNDKEEAKREMEFLESILSADQSIQKQVFGHPLVASFVFMKWERARGTFWFSLIFHIVIAIIYTIYVYSVFLTNCPYTRKGERNLQTNNNVSNISTNSSNCDAGDANILSSGFLFVIASLLAFLELLKFLQNIMLYCDTWRNFFQVMMILCMYMTVWPVQWTKHQSVRTWQYSAAAFGVFHVWSTLLINVGRLPKLGIYVEMLGKVSINFGYFIMAYAFLLMGFTFAFCVVFPNYAPFSTPLRAILQVIAMMSGEVDYAEFFYGPDRHNLNRPFSLNAMFDLDSTATDQLLHPFTAHILYGSFVVIVTIILTNLLIGLAVEDINILQQNAGLAQTTRGIANIAYLESLVFSNKLPNLGLIRNLRRSLYLGHIGQEEAAQNWSSRTEDDVDGKECFCNRLFRKFCARFRGACCEKRYLGGKYIFRISLEDCKRRQFPEDVFFKAIKIADMSQGQGSRESIQLRRKISRSPEHFYC